MSNYSKLIKIVKMSCELAWSNFKIFWKTLFMIIYPLVLLPMFVIKNTTAMRCLYIMVLMAGFWIFEILPLPVTSMIPMVLLPLMGIMDTEKTSQCYFKAANMMFVGGLMIALAIEYCDLHTRISLMIIKLIGCSYRRLSLGLTIVTMLVSMWISNTAATAMMIPIIEATLETLEKNGVGKMYHDVEVPDEEKNIPAEELPPKRPTNSTMCFFIGTAYAATIGGLGTQVGSGTNMAFVGLYDTLFPQSPGIEFNKWMMLNIPIMLVMMALTWLWLQIWFMGLFRPRCEDSQNIAVGPEGEELVKSVIKEKLDEMGPWTFHQILTGIMFLLVVFLWFFNSPKFVKGWSEVLTDTKVKDATPAILVVILLFVFPARSTFIHMWSKDETKRPVATSTSLVTWKYIQQKMHWSLVFLMGGGFALAEATKKSGMSTMIADSFHGLSTLSDYVMVVATVLMTVLMTQFISSNVAIASVFLPIVGTMASRFKLHPLHLMMPVGLASSFSFCLPISTPPNAIAAIPCNMSFFDMIKVGIGVEIIATLVLLAIFPVLAPVIWDFDHFPSWAVNTTSH